jgi:sugar lactone lactonase YvrE
MNHSASQWLGSALIGTAIVLSGCSKGSTTAADAATAQTAPPSPPAEISIPGTGVFPESLTSSSDGTIFIGSVGKAQVYRAKPGSATAEPFIAPGTGGIKQVFGVLADDATGTLWVCSNQVAAGGPPGPVPGAINGLYSFDLATGAAKNHFDFPSGGMCNDIAVAGNGDVYATDTQGMQLMRLPKGGSALEVWTAKDVFGPPGGVLDGIAVTGNRVIVNTLLTSKLFAVDIGADGKAGKVAELKLSEPVVRPDGMRTWGSDGVLTTNGDGKIQHVVISGDTATVQTVKDGLEGVVSVTTVGNYAYALEGQLGIMMAQPGTTPPAEKPYRAVGFALP